MTPKRAIVLGIIASVVMGVGQYLYYQGQSVMQFFSNGVPLAGAEMKILEFDSPSEIRVYLLDGEGRHDFGWSLMRLKETKWMSVKIRRGTNVVVDSIVSLPRGFKSLDFCAGSVVKATNEMRYTSFYSSTSITEIWPLSTNSPLSAPLNGPAKSKP